MKLTYLICILCLLLPAIIQGKDYDASLFGIESNGSVMNTNSIQKAIDYIHNKGGGRLIFHVGRYLSGSLFLRSNVTLHLKEGAVLLGSTNPFDYEYKEEWTAFIFALHQDSIAITGRGIIDGQGYQVAQNLVGLIKKGVIDDPRFSNDRPYARIRPQNLYFKGCRHILIQGIQINHPASWNQQFDQCSHLLIDQIHADCKNYWNNDGVDIVDCDSVVIKNSFFDASDDAICLKSHHPNFRCKDILIYNNTIRSSASAIKFGTYTFGGCQDIQIIKNTVYDTYRSAISFQMMDGNSVENILVDSLRVINTGNVFFF
jgi:polygalacturonase